MPIKRSRFTGSPGCIPEGRFFYEALNVMDKKEAREKMIQAVERFAPLTDELIEAIDELRAEAA